LKNEGRGSSMSDKDRDIFHVPRGLSQQALGAILRRWKPDNSWTQVRQLVQARRVLLDGNLATDIGQRLKAGQVIKLLKASLAATATDRDVRICYVDADLLVVDKPSGMTSIRHPDEKRPSARRYQHQPTLTELLPRLLARLDRGRGTRRASRAVRAVHRLDRETSGLMVFARNVTAERVLGQQFREHTIRRVYWAIVLGRIDERTIESQLVRDRGDGRRGSTSHPDAGKRAVTHVKPLEFLTGHTLVECRLETGRTHQIRIHLAECGHPVYGDKVYGTRPPDRGAMGVTPPRLALHAGHLGFRHPKNDRLLEFESPLPRDLQTLLERLRGLPANASGKTPTPKNRANSR
jgi:23S rRNA pseudouridine1911/1915/1917 synthase